MEVHLRNIPCPLCGLSDPTPLLPTVKYDDRRREQVIHDKIDVCLCETCGLVFENPQVDLTESHDYADKHYYNALNPIQVHDTYQFKVNKFRWHLLEHRLPWVEVSKALDVGASGAWSAWIKQQRPNIESVLVEPSREAVANCRESYPEVRAELGVFGEFDDKDGSYDLITFFYSFYTLDDPRGALAKARRLLSDDGRLLICISHVRMETEVWHDSLPWVNMIHLIRGVPLIYYSRRTLVKFLNISGFEIEVDFTVRCAFDEERSGRQEYYVIARKSQDVPGEINSVNLADLEEREASREFFLRYCDTITERSVAQFFHANQVNTVLLQHDGDPTYFRWLVTKLAPFCDQIAPIETPPGKHPVALPEEADRAGYVLLNATGRPSAQGLVAHAWRHLRVIECCHPTDAPYGSWVRNQDGDVLITRAFCPAMHHDFDLFPFTRRRAVNEVTAPP